MIEELFFEKLMSYGVLGLWTSVLLIEKIYTKKREAYQKKIDERKEEKLVNVIENNTIALTKDSETRRLCPHNY